MGVGEKPSGWDLARSYVLGRLSGDDLAKINDAAADASKAVKLMLTDGISAAMNQYNAKKSK